MKLIVTKSYEESSRVAANIYKEVIQNKKDALIGCATGSTPIGMYQCLIEDYKKGEIDFSNIRTVNLDEYVGLSREHNQSFSYFMYDKFFDHININKENIFLVSGEKDTQSQIENFNKFLEKQDIDILLLGIGSNGHVGFNEPDSCFQALAHEVELTQETIKANARFFTSEADVPRSAITMGMYGIAKAKKVVLIASGAAKAEAIKQLFADDKINPMLPCSILKLCQDATVIVDEELYNLTK